MMGFFLRTMMEKQMHLQNKALNYSISGKGSTVVLLHGFLESLRIWDRFAAALSGQYRVICIDLPGFGKSEVYGEIHRMEFMADAVKAVLEYEGISNCLMAGHSMGGYVGLAFAKKYPEMLAGLSLFHSHAAPDDEETRRKRDRTVKVVQKGKASFVYAFIPELFAPENRDKFRKEISRMQEWGKETNAEGIVAALRGMKERESGLSTLMSMNVPLHFIIGKQDPRIPYEKLLSQASLAGHADITFLDGVGHMGFIEAKKETLGSLQNFVSTCFDL